MNRDDIVSEIGLIIVGGAIAGIIYAKASEKIKRMEKIANETPEDRRYRLAEEAQFDERDVCMNCLTIEPSRCYCGNCNNCYGGTSSACNSCDSSD